jgi:hypothetical protein
MQNKNLTEIMATAAHLGGSVRAAGSYVTSFIDMTIFPRLLATLDIGVLTGAATVLIKFQQNSASASDDSGWADISTVSAITSAYTSTSNGKLAQLELRCDQYSGLGRYARVLASAATSSWTGGVNVQGVSQWTPATSYDHADVVATVVY